MQPNPDQSKSSLFTIGADRTLKAFNQPPAGTVQTYNPGSILDDKYEVVSQIGEGGMGAVFCVKHLMLGKEVALKTFLTTDFSDEAKIRFQREAQAIARLSHVSIVQVFDYGLIGGGIPYYTMEYLRGESLADRIKASGALNLEEALAIFLQVSQGLALAHSKGIIHRDLKPANLFLVGGMSATASGAVKIMDFGIASVSASPYAGTPDQRLTVVGAVFGSPLYMSPEQSLGQTVTERSDIYSLGCSLFETLTGRPPFLGKTAAETIMMHHSQAAPSLYDASGGKVFPSAVERMVATMLERRPELRQPSVQQLIGALQNALRGAKKKSIMMAMPDLEKRLTAGGSGPSVPDFEDQEVESNANGKSRGLGSGRRKALLLSLCGLCSVGLLAAVLCLQSPPSKPPPVVSGAASSSSSSSSLEKPSSKIESLPDYQGYAEMHFPNQQSIGRIVSLKNGAVISEGAGFLHWPLASLPCFMPSGDFVANGSNWQFLPSNSVNGIVVDICPPARDLPKLYEAVLRQQNLSKFELDGNGPDQSLVAVLDKLPSLRQLCLSDSTVPPVALAQYKGWQHLNNFVYCNSGDASMLLDRLKNSKNLVSLTVVGTHLNNADVKNIVSCPNIDALTLTDTGFSDNDLRQLLPLKELFSLHVADCPVTSASTNTLKIMASRHLRKLTLNRGAWTDGQLAILKQAGIKVCLADEASNIDLDRNHDLNEIILQDVDDAKNDK